MAVAVGYTCRVLAGRPTSLRQPATYHIPPKEKS